MSEPTQKKPRTEAQKRAFAQALKVREENILKKAREREEAAAAAAAEGYRTGGPAATETPQAQPEEPAPVETPVEKVNVPVQLAQAPLAPADESDSDYEVVDFDPHEFKSTFKQELDTDINDLRQQIVDLKSQLGQFGEQHQKLSNDMQQHHISKAHALNFV